MDNPSRQRDHLAEDLVSDITAAFQDVHYPGHDHIAYDQTGSHSECSEVAAAFRGKCWQDIDLPTLVRESSAVFFFTPAAFSYYLPAYLRAAILNHDDADVVPDTVVHSFVMPANADDRVSYDQRVSALSSRQLSAIKTVFLYLKRAYPDDNIMGDIDKAVDQVSAEINRGLGHNKLYKR